MDADRRIGVFVLIALVIIHGMVGWHRADMIAVPGEATFLDALRGLNIQPGDYRFPYGITVEEMTAPEFVAKMNQGPVGIMSVWQNWIWWGRSTRFTVTYSLDGIIYAVITGATFAWLWPR